MYNKAVFNGSKILIWKQITTLCINANIYKCCIQWLKDTNLKANHNGISWTLPISEAVFNGSKILIWKQITTLQRSSWSLSGCIQWLKDTNLKANHNNMPLMRNISEAVFNGSKILIWKQITTIHSFVTIVISCIQWLKDTNLKANHNLLSPSVFFPKLYSMAQRY